MAIHTGLAAPDRIVVVLHGAPVVLHADPSALLIKPVFARQIRWEVAAVLMQSRGKRLVSTFGLISPGKGDDVTGFGLALHGMLSDPDRLSTARQAARDLGDTLGWPDVGHRFAEIVRSTVLGREPEWNEARFVLRLDRELHHAVSGSLA
jgi:hypothetical protein